MISELVATSSATGLQALPSPRVAIDIRPAVSSDLAFIDSLQRMHTKAVGWMPTGQLEGCIKQERVLVAVAGGESVGYVLAADRYFKRDDVGIIYQMNVLPQRQRRFVGAALLKAQFERSAYGCKLYCCWCAQDLAANKFWEAMGFVPLAFRTGGTGNGKPGKARMHIFWQKRIRQGDETTPWWFPSETSNGAIRENRIVLPIPPGTHWSDAKPLVLPGLSGVEGPGMGENGEQLKQLPGPKKKRVMKPKGPVIPKAAIQTGGLRFGAAVVGGNEMVKVEEEPEKKPKVKNDPRLVAAARELKDRWLEHVDAHPEALLPCGKYDVSRALAEPGVEFVGTIAALPEPGSTGSPRAIAA